MLMLNLEVLSREAELMKLANLLLRVAFHLMNLNAESLSSTSDNMLFITKEHLTPILWLLMDSGDSILEATMENSKWEEYENKTWSLQYI